MSTATATRDIGPELESIALRHLFGLDRGENAGYNNKRVRSDDGKDGTMIGWLTLSDRVAVCWDDDGRVQEVPIGSLHLI